jgi:hypothetical protein
VIRDNTATTAQQAQFSAALQVSLHSLVLPVWTHKKTACIMYWECKLQFTSIRRRFAAVKSSNSRALVRVV